jgi:ferric-dicitrate binding protein FerR (iron transport regulator)
MTFWKTLWKQSVCMALCVAIASATTPVAKLKGAKVLVDGVAVPSAGNVNGWPVASGQEVSSGAEAAVLAMADGNQITLKPNTTARLIASADKPTLQLTKGEVSLDIKNPNAFQLKVAERTVTTDTALQSDVQLRPDNTVLIAKRAGRVLVDGAEPEPSPAPAPAPQGGGSGSGGGGGAPAWVYFVLAGGAAAGIATAVALTDDDEDSVSPSRP